MRTALLVVVLAVSLASVVSAQQIAVAPKEPTTVTYETTQVDGRWVTIAKIVMPITVVEQPTVATTSASWCVQGNESDCITLSSGGGEVISGVFTEGTSVYADAIGYRRGNRISMAFRRTTSDDIGFATLILRDERTADGRTFNPDGTQRWQGVYLLRSR